MSKEWFGIVRWHPDDLIAAAASNGIKMTKKQAILWWEKNESNFIDIMTGYGNEVLSEMDFEA